MIPDISWQKLIIFSQQMLIVETYTEFKYKHKREHLIDLILGHHIP